MNILSLSTHITYADMYVRLHAWCKFITFNFILHNFFFFSSIVIFIITMTEKGES